MRRSLTVLLFSTSAFAAEAHAQAPGEVAITEAAPETPAPEAPTSYRRQLMIADGIAAGAVGVAVAAGTWIYDPEDFHLPLMVGGFGFSSYVMGAPIFHFAHGNVWRGLLSGGARILFPAIGSAVVTTAAGYEDEGDGSARWGAAFGGGMALGAVGAMLLDWYVLTPSYTTTTEHSAPPVAPTISASAEHVFLGVGGSL